MADAADHIASELETQLAEAEARYRDALHRNNFLESELRAAEAALLQLREKVRQADRKEREAEFYKARLQRLRRRWYLRPFIPRGELLPLMEEPADCWQFRGPAFAAPAERSDAKHPRRRVLIVGHALGSMLFGSENSLLDTIRAIDPSRFDVFVVFPGKNPEVFQKIEPHVQGIAVLNYDWWRMDRPSSEETVGAFADIYRRQAIDLVHVNTITVRDPLIAARRARLPSVVNARELISLDEQLVAQLGGTAAEIAQSVCDHATYVLANSAITLADYPCAGKGSYAYNSVDAAAFDFPNRVDPARINVGLVSSNLVKKGVEDFLELARRAEQALPNLQFHLIGPENDLTRQWQAAGNSLPQNFHLRGYVASPPDAYRGLNIVLNLSRFAESFGRTVAEAMAARCAVIAYRYGALPELIDDGETGFLTPYRDLDAVFDRLSFFAADPARISEFGERARTRASERFSPETLRAALTALYDRLLSNAEPTSSNSRSTT